MLFSRLRYLKVPLNASKQLTRAITHHYRCMRQLSDSVSVYANILLIWFLITCPVLKSIKILSDQLSKPRKNTSLNEVYEVESILDQVHQDLHDLETVNNKQFSILESENSNDEFDRQLTIIRRTPEALFGRKRIGLVEFPIWLNEAVLQTVKSMCMLCLSRFSLMIH